MVSKRFYSIKPEIRVLGIDDGRFVPHSEGTVEVVGVVYRGGYWFEGIMHTKISIDGLDATEKIAAMVNDSSYYGELRVIFLDGLTFAGFNIVDINNLFLRIDLPVISVTRKKPDLNEIKSALKNLSNLDERLKAMENAGVLFAVETRNGENPVYVQKVGISQTNVKRILRMTSTRSNIPEPLRVAHIIASGLTGLNENI